MLDFHPTGVSKSFNNTGKHRSPQCTKKYWRIYGYDDNGKFRSERVKSFLGLKPFVKLWYRLRVECARCDNIYHIVVSNKKHQYSYLCKRCEPIETLNGLDDNADYG